MAPYVTTAFGRKALGNMPGRQTSKRAGGGGGAGSRAKMVTPTLDMVLARLWGNQLSPADMRKQARQEANFAMQDSLRGLRLDYQREYEQLRREGEAYKQVQGILGSYSGSDAQAIRDAYNAAAAGIGGMNTGLVSSVQGAQQGALDTATQNAVTTTGIAPQEQGGPAANAVVGQHLGVTLPVGATTATGEALGQGALEKGMALARQAGYQADTELAGQIAELRDEYLMQRAGLRAKKPGLIREAMKGYEDQGLQQLSTIITALGLGNTMYGTQAGVTLDQAKLAAQVAADQAQSARDKKKAKTEAYAAMGLAADGKTPLPGYYKHPNGQILEVGTYPAPDGSIQKVPSGMHVGKGGKLVDNPSTSTNSVDPVQAEQNFRRYARDMVDNLIKVDERGRAHNVPPKKKLIQMIMNQYSGPLLKRFGKKLLRQWATDVVNSFPDSYWTKGSSTGTKTTPSGTNVQPVTED